jgi:metallo-beta-lactamase family protein
VIISASGMCEAGRIRHHIKNNIRSKKNTILVVGFQAQHTLGRRLADGADKITLFHEKMPVRAEVIQIHGFSGHADQADLLKTLSPKPGNHRRVFLVHGEENQSATLAGKLRENGVKDVTVAARGQRVKL